MDIFEYVREQLLVETSKATSTYDAARLAYEKAKERCVSSKTPVRCRAQAQARYKAAVNRAKQSM